VGPRAERWIYFSRFQRCEVTGDCYDVGVGQVGYGSFHERRSCAVAGAVLKVDNLPGHLTWRAACDGWNVAGSFEVWAVAGGAWDCLSTAAGLDERFSLSEASDGNIGDESGGGVAEFGLFEVFGEFDDALADGLCGRGFYEHQHSSGDAGFGDGV
jgi:hypothetical protein